MSVEQVEEAAVRVVSETGHVRGLEEITGVFDKGEVAVDPGMWGTQISGVPGLERKAGGQRHHLLQTAAKEVWNKQKNADGGGTRLQVPIPGRGINKSTIHASQGRRRERRLQLQARQP